VRVSGTRALHVVASEELGARAAAAVADVLRDVVARTGRCSLVLSGGDTPRGLHRALARNHADLPWDAVHVFWSDERYVPPDDPRSNYGMARATLLDHVPCPSSNIHPMPTSFADADAAARAYEATLAEFFGGARTRFDLAILGVGADGHTASLFPHADSLNERERSVLAVRGDADPPLRLTLTLPALLASARSWFLVDGANKARVVRDVLAPAADERALPAAAILRAQGSVEWWLERAAASALDPQTVAHASH